MPKRSSESKDKKASKKQKEESNDNNNNSRPKRDKKEKEPKEIVEDDDITKDKVKKLADLIRKSRHIVFHVGAGISTAASIPDFRGPQGVWTLQDKGKDEKEIDYGVEFEDALPTLSHMALVALTGSNAQGKPGIVKYIVSQNVDGLFLRSGIKPELLSELHGNVYLEVCKKCKAQYLRDFDAAADGNDRHYTGRLCDKEGCGGKLGIIHSDDNNMVVDSIINFGEDLPEQDLERAIEHSKKADLSIVVGSSLTGLVKLVTPACEFPEMTVKNGGKLVIVNLMKTPYDKDCELRLYAKSDGVFRTLMEELNIPIPSFSWNMKVWVGHNSEKGKGNQRTYHLFVAGDCGFATRFIQKVFHAGDILTRQAEIKLPPLAVPISQKPPTKQTKKTKTVKSTNSNNNNQDNSEWNVMDGEGEGIFEQQFETNSTDDFSVTIRLHFAARLNIEPQEIQYQVSSKPKSKKESFESQKTYTVHLRDIVFK